MVTHVCNTQEARVRKVGTSLRTPMATSKLQDSQSYQNPFSKNKAGKIVQQVIALAAKLDDLSLIQKHTWYKKTDFREVF